MISLTNNDINEIREIFSKYAPFIGNAYTEEEIWVATVVDFLRTNKDVNTQLVRALLKDTVDTEVSSDSGNYGNEALG
jgi:hypothetical protein